MPSAASITAAKAPRAQPEEPRRAQLIEVTIDSLAEKGFVGSTLAEIAGRANVSPGLVAHYFGDKDGLLEAAFRSLTRRLGAAFALRLRQARTPPGAHSGGDRRQSRRQRIPSAHRRRVARLLGPGSPDAEPWPGSGGLSASHAVQPAACAEGADRARGGAAAGRHDRGDDRRSVAARGPVHLARSGQRDRHRHADRLRRQPPGRSRRRARRRAADGRDGRARRLCPWPPPSWPGPGRPSPPSIPRPARLWPGSRSRTPRWWRPRSSRPSGASESGRR